MKSKPRVPPFTQEERNCQFSVIDRRKIKSYESMDKESPSGQDSVIRDRMSPLGMTQVFTATEKVVTLRTTKSLNRHED